MKHYPLLQTLKRIPSGLMMAPLIFTVLLHSFFPSFLELGDPITATFTSKGTMCITGIALFIYGCGCKYSSVVKILKRTGVLVLVKLVCTMLIGYLFLRCFGMEGLWGISGLAFVAVICSVHPGNYLSLNMQYGDEIDTAGIWLIHLIYMPCIPIVVIGLAGFGGGTVDYLSIVCTLIPFVFGMILGNLDPEFAEFMSHGAPITLFFLGFCFGSVIDLHAVIQAGLGGILLTLLFFVIHFLLLVPVDRHILHRPGYSSISMCSVAGIAIAIPTLICATMPELAVYASAATAQIAMAVLFTSVGTPFVTKFFVKRWGSARDLPSAENAGLEAAQE